MRTVASLVGSATTTSISAVGLTLASTAREEPVPSPAVQRVREQDMTEVATYAAHPFESHTTNLGPTLPRSYSTPLVTRIVKREGHGNEGLGAWKDEKSDLTRRDSAGSGRERQTDGRRVEGTWSQAGTPDSRPQSWLRRLSSSMSASRDSSRASSSRPGSATVSHSNASMAFSQAGSTTPIFGGSRRSSLPPNKLVKRASSVRSTYGSPTQSPGSRLPLPVFRRPATSHQRAATLEDQLSGGKSDFTSFDNGSYRSLQGRDGQLRHYFTPRIAADELLPARRRNSTGIPNPIRRVYPDRKYTPVLVSSRQRVQPAPVELDSRRESTEDVAISKLNAAASSPLPAPPSQFDSAAPRHSFSVGDILSTGPEPLWRRPPSSRGEGAANKLARKSKSRVASAPMGGVLSSSAVHDSERPAKRQLTDPQGVQRIIDADADFQHREIDLGLGATTQQSQQFTFTSPADGRPSSSAGSTPVEQRGLASATSTTTAAQHARVSGAQSELTESTVGSDSERRSTGGYSTDYQSDTVYDSYPTRTTNSGSGKRGPPIDTIFDDSPSLHSSGRSTKLGDFLNDGHDLKYRHSTIEEEESVISTPVRSLRERSITSTPPAKTGAPRLFASSPPAIMPDPDDIDWDAPDDEPPKPGVGLQQIGGSLAPDSLDKSLPFRLSGAPRNPASAHSTPSRYSNGGVDKANPFDWSEIQPSPNHQLDQSPPRPRTVHGKKEPDQRGSRGPGRRPPSGMHARSHSVPVAPDVDGKRGVVANKFGTWGVGSKGVTEDWNEDFDFEEPAEPPLPTFAGQGEKRIDSGHVMVVPKSIREQQNNVVANIGLLREWGLLIEELKDLRMRAVALDVMRGPHADAWQEVDAMIELADQESEEATLQPSYSRPTSPDFDFSAFDEPAPEMSPSIRARASVLQISEPSIPEGSVALPAPQVGSPQEDEVAAVKGRPRKDSEAVARSVIEALQTKRNKMDSTLKPAATTKKVPFDTATLRHIVPYVNGLKRKVKDVLRETEGLYSSPRRRFSNNEMSEREIDVDQSFRSIFDSPQPDSPSANKRRSRREQAVTDHDEPESPVDGRNDLVRKMQNLALPEN